MSGQLEKDWEEKGFVVIKNLLDEDQVSYLKEKIGSVGGEYDASVGTDKLKERTTLLSTDKGAGEIVIDISEHDFVENLLDDFERPAVEHSKVLVKAANAPVTPWHQDAGFWKDFDPKQTMFTAWVALSPVNKENGCLRILDSKDVSHGTVIEHGYAHDNKEREIPEQMQKELLENGSIFDAELEPGDALLFRSFIVHSAYENTTSSERAACKVVYQDLAKRGSAGRALSPRSVILYGPIGKINEEFGCLVTRLRQKSEKLVSYKRYMDLIKKLIIKVAGKVGFVPFSQVNVWDKRKGNLINFQHNAKDKEWAQMMMYNEMMYKIKDVPGDVMEFGVAAGISFISFVRILNILEGGEKRKVYGFDSFEGLPDLQEEDQQGGGYLKATEMKKGGYDHPESYPALFAFAEKEKSAELIKGWFDKTLPEFLEKNPHVSLAFVHLDADLYESTKVALEHTWDRLEPGGIILFDELNKPGFPGETTAYREFFEDKSGKYSIHFTEAMPKKRYIVKL